MTELVSEPGPPTWEADDLRHLLVQGRERGRYLLTAGEGALLERMLALAGPVFAVYANLTGRVERPHDARGLPDAVTAALFEAGLVDKLVPVRALAASSTVPELRDGCRRLGLPVSGAKADLVARLTPHRGWWAGDWFRVRHRGLLRRLEQWAQLEAWPDRKGALLERLGRIRWATYPLTSGTALFPDRRALLQWEAAQRATEPQDALRAWSAGHAAAPGRMSLVAVLAERVRVGAEAAERSGDLAGALALYAGWPGRRAEVAFREARVREGSGDLAGASKVLRAGLADAHGAEVTALVRAGRRLARALGSSFPPAPPSTPLVLRTIHLPAAPPSGPRPRWGAGDVVEAAVVRWLANLGRTAFHGESGPWRTVVSLLLADLYFLPLPGVLPVARLDRPLDLGTPQFAVRRQGELEARCGELAISGAPALLEAALERWRGIRLAGVDPSVPESVLRGLAAAVPASGWEHLVRWRAAGRSFRGLPDLVVLPGPEVTLPDAHPRRLGAGLCAAELKGPTDTLRDHQADWLAALVQLGVTAELWEVRAPRRDSAP